MKQYIVDFQDDNLNMGFNVVVFANNCRAAKRRAVKMVKNQKTKRIREALEWVGSPVHCTIHYRPGHIKDCRFTKASHPRLRQNDADQPKEAQ